MVLKADQERVMGLLKDTITLLCKNGLNFQNKFCVDAVIGVTVDEDELFYISVKEIVKSEKALLEESKPPVSSDDSDGGGSLKAGDRDHKRQKRKRRLKHEAVSNADEATSQKASEPASPFPDLPGREDGSNMHSDSESADKRLRVKKEDYDEDDPDEDIVFIKQELDDNSWSQSQDISGADESFGNYSAMPGSSNMPPGSQQQDQNFASLADMNLTPMDGASGSGMWSSPQPPRRPYIPRGPRTSTVTSDSQQQHSANLSQSGDQSIADPQQLQTASDDPPASGIAFFRKTAEDGQEVFECSLCGKHLKGLHTCEKHQRHHRGIYKYHCDQCTKGFDKYSDLQSHVNAIHFDTKLFTCQYCSKSYNFRRGLVHHIRVKHADQETSNLLSTP